MAAATREEALRQQALKAGVTEKEIQDALKLEHDRKMAARADILGNGLEGAVDAIGHGGRENTVDGSNFTLTKTLKNLHARYGHLAQRHHWNKILDEILAYARTAAATNRYAYQGAEYYSHRSKQDWDAHDRWDVSRAFTVPQSMYLWWLAANDTAADVTRCSPVATRRKVFLEALEDTVRAHNRDNPEGIDAGGSSSPSCRMGFKNKFAESFKEIKGALHPANVYFPDIGGHIRGRGTKFFLMHFLAKSTKEQMDIKAAFEAVTLNKEQVALIETIKKVVGEQLIRYVPEQLGVTETPAEATSVKKAIDDFIANIEYVALPPIMDDEKYARELEEEEFQKLLQEVCRRSEAEARRKAEEAERKRKIEEARKKVEEEARKKAEEEARQRAAEEAAFQKEIEEACRRSIEEEKVRKKAEEEAARKKAEEARRKAMEEDEKFACELQMKLDHEAQQEREHLRLQTEARKKVQEAARLRKEDEDRRNALEEAMRRKAFEDICRKAEEDEQKRKIEEAHKKVAEEAARKKATEEAAKAALEASAVTRGFIPPNCPVGTTVTLGMAVSILMEQLPSKKKRAAEIPLAQPDVVMDSDALVIDFSVRHAPGYWENPKKIAEDFLAALKATPGLKLISEKIDNDGFADQVLLGPHNTVELARFCHMSPENIQELFTRRRVRVIPENLKVWLESTQKTHLAEDATSKNALEGARLKTIEEEARKLTEEFYQGASFDDEVPLAVAQERARKAAEEERQRAARQEAEKVRQEVEKRRREMEEAQREAEASGSNAVNDPAFQMSKNCVVM